MDVTRKRCLLLLSLVFVPAQSDKCLVGLCINRNIRESYCVLKHKNAVCHLTSKINEHATYKQYIYIYSQKCHVWESPNIIIWMFGVLS